VGEFNNYVVVRNVPSEVSFTVTNTSTVPRELEMTINMPGRHEVLRDPGVIAAGATEEVVISILPEEKFEGSEFVGTIMLKLGNDTAEKNLKIVYARARTCVVSIAPLGSFDEAANKFTIDTQLTNNGVEAAEVELSAIKGIPSDWKVGGDRKAGVRAGETRNIQTTLTPGSDYAGQAQLVYNCDGFAIERIVVVKFERPITSAFDNIGAGFASLFGGTGGDGAGFDWGLAINVILILLAAILLIAFIARMVKMLDRQENQKFMDYEPPAEQPKVTKSVVMKETVEIRKENHKSRNVGKLESYNPKLEDLKERITSLK